MDEQRIFAQFFLWLVTMAGALGLVALIIRHAFHEADSLSKTMYYRILLIDPGDLIGSATSWSYRPSWKWWVRQGLAFPFWLAVYIPLSIAITWVSVWIVSSSILLSAPFATDGIDIFRWDITLPVSLLVAVLVALALMVQFWSQAVRDTKVIREFRCRKFHLFSGRTYKGEFAQDA